MKTKSELKEYNKEWSKKYYSIPANREKRKQANEKWRKEHPEHRSQYYTKNKKKFSEYNKKNQPRYALRVKDYQLKRKFGITLGEYQLLFDVQKGLCAICGKAEIKRLAVDHNHQTGKVRGLLCSRCNTSIGLMYENIDSLQKMIQYLRV